MKREKTVKKSFEFNSIVLFALMMMANVCNYLFQIVIARLLGDAEKFGIINTLISFQAICTIPNTLMVMVTAKYVAQYAGEKSEEKLTGVLLVIKRYVRIIGVLMIALGGVLTPLIARNFQLDEKEYIFIVLVASALLTFSSVYVGCLQGGQEFFEYGMQNLINVLTRLVIGAVLVLLGLEVIGVLGSLVLGAIFVCLYTYIYSKKYFLSKSKENVDKSIIDGIKKYILGIFCFQTCINLLTNGDMLLVKTFFSGEEAGIYSSAMVIGKIALYVSGAVVGTLFPMVAMEHSQGNDTAKLLKKAFCYGGGVAVACALGLVVAGKYVISVLFGEDFLQAVEYLPAICLYVVPLAFLTILTNFLAAVGKTRLVSGSLAIACAGAVTLAIVFHESVIQMMCGVGVALSLVFLGDLFIYLKRKKNEV